MKQLNNSLFPFTGKTQKLKWLLPVLCFISSLVYSQATYTFNNCGATGHAGPTAAQVNTSYTLTNLAGNVSVTATGIQTWTVPTTGLYKVTAYGAGSGSTTAVGMTPGLGAIIAGEFNMTAGDVLHILVGQRGQDHPSYAAGGGGGSFVTKTPHNTQASILVIAGGGGAPSGDFPGLSATTGTCGTFDIQSGPAQCGGNGGITFTGNSGGGGGGFFTDGGGSATGVPVGGSAYVNGGTGAITTSGYTEGGFGGGGGEIAAATYLFAGSGGGGFSGGNGGNRNSTQGTGRMGGGGGGSYNSGANQTSTISTVLSQGLVVIESLCSISLGASTTNSAAPAICSGQSLTLTTNAASNYTWSNGNTTTTSIVVSPTITTTYSVIGTSTANCVASSAITVTVSPGTPTLSLAGTTPTVCLGAVATITASGALNYTISNGSANGGTFSPTSTAAYTVTGINGCGTTSVATTITVSALPVIAAPSSTLVCSTNAVTLTASGATSYTWTAPTATNTNSVYIVSPVSNTTYTLVGITGSCSGINTITIGTKPLPALSITPSSSTTCNGNPVTLSVSGNANTYTWNPGNQTGLSISVSPTTTTLYSVVGTNSVNCTSSTSQVVIVTPNPTVNVSVSNPIVCPGGSSTLTASGAESYTWTNTNGTSLVVNPTSNTTYNVIGSYTATGCSGTGTAAVSVLTPTLAVSGNTSVCSGSIVSVSANGADTYTWSTGGSGAAISITPTLTTVYTVTGSVVDQNTFISCDASNSLQVTVNANPVITATADYSIICINNSAVLTAAGAGANGTYTWTGGSGAVHSATNLVIPIANQAYSVAAIDDNGCKGSAGISIQVSPCTGIANVAANASNLVVYPNPSNGEFTITSDQNITLQIINELGQQVRTITFGSNSSEVKVNGLANGVYFITGANENGSVKEKIVIAK